MRLCTPPPADLRLKKREKSPPDEVGVVGDERADALVAGFMWNERRRFTGFMLSGSLGSMPEPEREWPGTAKLGLLKFPGAGMPGSMPPAARAAA